MKLRNFKNNQKYRGIIELVMRGRSQELIHYLILIAVDNTTYYKQHRLE
jgi:hypothetical protein